MPNHTDVQTLLPYLKFASDDSTTRNAEILETDFFNKILQTRIEDKGLGVMVR